jgi:transcriptional regulator with XRE-family HTH domain
MPKERNPVSIKSLRVERGMKQSDVAGQLRELGHKIDQAAVSRIEKGDVIPTIDLVVDMAIVYGSTYLEFTRRLGYTPDEA